MENSKAVSDSQQAVSAERNTAYLSVQADNPDLSQFDGQIVSKDADVTATVTLDGNASEQQLTVTLRAMCQNALEAIGGGGQIEIGLGQTEHHVEIRVTDNGPGIPPEQRRHLFDPYYSARQAGRGLGLGLSKAWRIVTNHGGRIDVESEPGHGATFIITLPHSDVA